MAKLTIVQRNRVVGMLQTGMSQRAVARTLNSCHWTILRLWTLFQQTGDVPEQPKSGRRGSQPLHKTGMFSFVFLRPNKNISVVRLTCQKKQGRVGREIFFFKIFFYIEKCIPIFRGHNFSPVTHLSAVLN